MTHPGALSSTTTVTGLPSTPSRNEMRQPQASRACTKPLSMWGILPECRSGRPPPSDAARASSRVRILLQERLDIPFVLRPALDACVLPANLAVTADQKGCRNPPDRSEGVLHVVTPEAHE